MSDKPLRITPEMAAAICAPIPNFHKMWEQYRKSDFRRELLRDWAGEDFDKRVVVERLLDDTK